MNLVKLSLTRLQDTLIIDETTFNTIWSRMYKLHLLLIQLLLIQSDLVSHSLTIALPRALLLLLY